MIARERERERKSNRATRQHANLILLSYYHLLFPICGLISPLLAPMYSCEPIHTQYCGACCNCILLMFTLLSICADTFSFHNNWYLCWFFQSRWRMPGNFHTEKRTSAGKRVPDSDFKPALSLCKLSSWSFFRMMKFSMLIFHEWEIAKWKAQICYSFLLSFGIDEWIKLILLPTAVYVYSSRVEVFLLRASYSHDGRVYTVYKLG